jgi:hypothetical protein
VQLVISDSHRGLTNAIATVLQGAAWQRCRVHFMRNALAKVNKSHGEMVAATIRTVFAQPTPDTVRDQVEDVADTLAGRFPAVAELLREAKADLTAFADFPQAHWRKIWSTNPIERLNREVKRRTNVVGILPNTDALLRLSACVLIEAHDEWQDSDRRYLSEESMALLNPPAPTALEPRRDDPNEGDGPARTADGIVTITAKQHATSYTTLWDVIFASDAWSSTSCSRRRSRPARISSAFQASRSRVARVGGADRDVRLRLRTGSERLRPGPPLDNNTAAVVVQGGVGQAPGTGTLPTAPQPAIRGRRERDGWRRGVCREVANRD